LADLGYADAPVSSLLEQLASLDREALEATQAIRWAPLTALFVLATAWWVKGCVFACVAGLMDARARRWFPATALIVIVVGMLADLTAYGFKLIFDRTRPPEGEALKALPESPSFPSGHATMSFALAALLGALHPRLRVPLYALAAVIAVSRPYLGVHYWLDVAAGAALGTALGLAVAWALRRTAILSARPAAA
jgi:membrane-associated phospholipid phosphatase